jgi:succinate dehydrogenase/fumarate reductase iron-sulfur protein
MKKATFKIWRGNKDGGDFKSYDTEISEGMVVLDAVLQIQAEQASDLACRWNCKAGKCGSCSAEINGNPKLMCMTRMNTLPTDEPITVEPMQAFPLKKDLVTDVSWNYEVKKRIKKFNRVPPMPKTERGEWRRKTLTACRNFANVSNVSCVRTCATSCAIITNTKNLSVRAFSSMRRHSKCTRSIPKTV